MAHKGLFSHTPVYTVEAGHGICMSSIRELKYIYVFCLEMRWAYF